ncbi:MAG: IS21 family transposase [Spirochaetes bacterium]|nr:IS21 family transposase [Spirochaetota bacterium]
MSVYEDIQRCKRFGKEKSVAARQLGLARGTVRKFWNMSERDYDGYRRRALTRRHRFDAYREEIIKLVELNAADGQTVHGSSIYDVLEERHGVLPGSERTLRNYVRILRETGAIDIMRPRPVRRPQEESAPGDQLQVDFGEQPLAGRSKAYIYAAVLAASRARYVAVQDHPFRTVEVIRHTLEAFRYLGGRAKTLVIDQDRLMTVSENAGEIRHTAEFEHFVREQDLKVWLCRKADPQSKGKVENLVKFVKTSFFSARRFETVNDIHEPLAAWLTRRANGKIHQATGRIPAVVLEREEQPALRTLKQSVYDHRGAEGGETRKADEKGLISFLGNRYSVPAEYAEATVAVRSDRLHVRIGDVDTGCELAVHRLPQRKGSTFVLEHHRVPRGYGADEAYEELSQRLSGALWPQYLEENREKYRRYWKDQTGALRRFLDTDPDPDILAQALTFCCEAASVGAGDLKYAYEHLWESHDGGLPPLLEHARAIVAARSDEAPNVAKRRLRYYSSIVSLVAGGAA